MRSAKFLHRREPARIDNQTVIRLNRDTLYSSAVFDLDAGPVTITLPDAGKRFMSMQVISEDHYVAGSRLRRRQLYARPGRRSARAMSLSAIRTLVDPVDPEGHRSRSMRCRTRSRSSQKAAGKFEVPNWDQASQKKVRDALLVLGNDHAGLQEGLRHQGRGRSRPPPDRNRRRLGRQPGQGRDLSQHHAGRRTTATTVYKLDVKDVPVDGFWSVSLYNAEGYYEKNPYNAYSLNNITAKKNADGSIAIQFGGCDGKIPNCLPIMKGWNYTVRLYRPRAEILNGKWKFPEPQPVS